MLRPPSGLILLAYNTGYAIISFMEYRMVIIESEEYSSYPEIPERYIDNTDEDSIIMGAVTEEPEEMLEGLIICTRSLFIQDAAKITYLWGRRRKKFTDVFSEMLPAFINSVTGKNIRSLYFSLVDPDGPGYDPAVSKLLEANGFKKIKEYDKCSAYYVSDFYDTGFMRSNVVKASQDEHLYSFSVFSDEECRKNILNIGAGNDDLYVIEKNAGCFFYIDKDEPVGAVTVSAVGRNAFAIDRIYIKNTAGRKKILKALLAGVMAVNLEGLGMDALMYTCDKAGEDLRVFEECLGESGMELKIMDFLYVADQLQD